MRIISKQPDYYDYAMAYGVDNSIVYHRKPRDGGIPKEYRDFARTYSYYDSKNRGVGIHKISIVICGKMYRFYARSDEPGKLYVDAREAADGLTSRFWNNLSAPKEYTKDYSYINDQLGGAIVVFGAGPVFGQKEDYKFSTDTFNQIHFDHNIYCVDAPILKYLGVPDHIPATEIYMALDAWFSSRGQVDMENISDKSKIQKAGFDLKQSFRHRK